jgi:hypothetical protein
MSSSFARSWSSNVLPFLLLYAVYLIDNKFSGIAIYPIYLLPIFWITSKWGSWAGVSFAVFSAGLSTPMSPLLGWDQNIAYLDMLIARSATLALLALFYSNFISQAKSNRTRVERLKSIVPQCPDCGAVYCRDGKWRSLEQLISNPKDFGVMPKHICPTVNSQIIHKKA